MHIYTNSKERYVIFRVKKFCSEFSKCNLIHIDLVILGRFVRICLFDGKNILSNIHILKATVEKDESTWLFKTNANDGTKVLESSELFFRCQMPQFPSTMGILFELSMHVLKKVKT